VPFTQIFLHPLEIFDNLAKTNPNVYLPDVATTLNNLAMLHQTQDNYEDALKEFEKALKIRRKLAKTNPNVYLPDLASVLNNLGVLHQDQGNFKDALKKYKESTNLYEDLATSDYQTYLPYLAGNYGNLAWFYTYGIPQREESIDYAIYVIMILQPHYEKIPFTQEFYAKALNILRNWDLSDEEIYKLIEEKMKEDEQM
jgi:tetratricopeptide (TPR) repeat protein